MIWGAFKQHGVTEIRSWICNCMYCFMWNAITQPCPDIKEIGEWMSKTSHSFMWMQLLIHAID